MAKVVPEDPFCGIADPSQIDRHPPQLEILEPKEPSEAELIALVREAEATARDVKGVTNSEGAEAGWGRSEMAMLASNGFYGGYAQSHSGLSRRRAGGRRHRHGARLRLFLGGVLRRSQSAAALGKSAGERAVRRLNPRKVATEKVPIVLDPRISGSMISHVLGAINGGSIAPAAPASLRIKWASKFFAPDIDIVEDPHRARGLRSMPFDGEGLPTSAAS